MKDLCTDLLSCPVTSFWLFNLSEIQFLIYKVEIFHLLYNVACFLNFSFCTENHLCPICNTHNMGSYGGAFKKQSIGLTWWSSGLDSEFLTQGAPVWSLVGQLRSHMLHGITKNRKQNKAQKQSIALNPLQEHD